MHIARTGEVRNAHKIFVGKLEGEDIRMEIGQEGVDWMHMSQDRGQWWAFVNT
jgi:hypothetical protein